MSFSLVVGACCVVRFSAINSGSTANATLNLNSTGAKDLKIYATDPIYVYSNYTNSPRVVLTVYDGSYWQLIDPHITTYSDD